MAEVWSDFAAVTIFNALQRDTTLEGKGRIKLPEYVNLLMERNTYFGRESIKSEDIIFVHYRGDTLLVNEEISERYPDISYKDWLNRPFGFAATASNLSIAVQDAWAGCRLLRSTADVSANWG